uniref:phospholipid-transporting ATPase ABCA1-like n=1 Tax=Myxine glutinosa TaxID=7769 RepID=UPI00358E46A7
MQMLTTLPFPSSISLDCNSTLYALIFVSDDVSQAKALLCNLTQEQKTSFLMFLASSIQTSDPPSSTLLKFLTPLPEELVKQFLQTLTHLNQEVDQARDLKFFINKVQALSTNGTPVGILGLVCGDESNVLFGEGMDNINASSSNNSGGTNGVSMNMDINIGSSLRNDSLCSTLELAMQSSAATRVAWFMLKPFLLGRIPYLPDTPLTRSLLQQANSTFEALALLGRLDEAWAFIKPAIRTTMQKSPLINLLKNVLINPQLAPVVTPAFIGSGLSPDVLLYLLTDGWQVPLQMIDHTVLYVTSIIKCLELNKFEPQSSEDQLIKRSHELLSTNSLWGALVFESQPGGNEAGAGPHVRYKIRMDAESVETTRRLRRRIWTAEPRNYSLYLGKGFAYLQDMLDSGISRFLSHNVIGSGLYVQGFPHPCHVNDIFLKTLSRSLPMFLTLAWIYAVAMTTRAIVQEKEARLAQMMMMMGLQATVLRTAWFLSSLMPFLVSSFFLLLVLKLGNVLTNSNVVLLFIFLATFSMATVAQSFLLSTFFSKASLASACAGIIYFLLYLPYAMSIVWQDQLTFSIRASLSLISTVAFGYGVECIAELEEQGSGAQWSNVALSPSEESSYSLLTSILFMLLDTMVYALATCYIENVFPGKYGVPRPWYFLFIKSYWCGSSQSDVHPIPSRNKQCSKALLEDEPTHMPIGVAICDLVKAYNEGRKLAVNGLTINFYQGQITSFLGHNGAGKTTTMSILTGLFPPTSGTAYVLGRDIRTEMNNIRKGLGMCPQHNILFNGLTVEEHIWFYGRLKGCTEDEVKKSMQQILEDVGLPHKRKELSQNLSGGMQRKLSVAIAFVGGSSVVILDEPTAGVDPYARRGIWDLLLKYRKDRTIILSTHHMDEAEVLGDRVAIVANGSLICCGSPRFLKTHFGHGYHLTLSLPQQLGNSDDSVDEGIGDEIVNGASPTELLNVADICRLVTHHVANSKMLERRGHEANAATMSNDEPTELNFVLPYSGAVDGSFVRLFEALDNASIMGSSTINYGLSDTPLEEIFLKVAEDHDLNQGIKVEPPGEHTSSTRRSEDDLLSGFPLILQQFWALLVKRFHHARRSRKGFVAQIILPVVFVCLALAVSKISPSLSNAPSLELQPWMYGQQHTFYSDEDDGRGSLAGALLESPGLGTRCMPGDPIPNLPCKPGNWPWETPAMSEAAANELEGNNWDGGGPSPPCVCPSQLRQVHPICAPGAGGPPPRQKRQNTTDILQDLTEHSIMDHLIKTFPKFYKTRYGGLSLGASNPAVLLQHKDSDRIMVLLARIGGFSDQNVTKTVGVSLEDFIGTQSNIKVWFNSKIWHGVAAFMNVAGNIKLRSKLATDVDPKTYGITAYNHPINLTLEQQERMQVSAVDLLVSICVIFALSFVPASFVVFLIAERVSKAKHLQIVSGVNPLIYWLANYSWDMCNYLLPALLVIVIFLCFQVEEYVSSANLPVLILLLLLYGWSITPLMYPASFFFSVPSTAYVSLTSANLFVGINGSLATFILELIPNNSNLKAVNDFLKKYLLVFPHFCLGRGLIDLAANQKTADRAAMFGLDSFQDPFTWDIVGRNLFAMAVEGPVFFLINIFIQYHFFCRTRRIEMALPHLGNEDDDVARERDRVLSGRASNDFLRIMDIVKVYNKKRGPAVDRITLGVRPGECFGLLGVNGAGKTTTFKMLTGDEDITCGEAFLKEYSVISEHRAVHQRMGYCPQFDAIDELLTAREHLQLYARLRGIPKGSVSKVAEEGLTQLGLLRYADCTAGTYSGGNKRKLSTAVALTGSPPVIFLDEPTAGMDPQARRFLWECIGNVVREGRSVILTSHSMEECEALCTRIAIMVNGRFQCLGSVQHLKNKFGDGYTLELRLSGTKPDVGPVETFLHSAFPGATVQECHHTTLRYQLPLFAGEQACSLSRAFDLLAQAKERLGLEDYSISQTTLDQVFVRFAKHQHEQSLEENGASVEGTRPAVASSISNNV